MALRKEQADLIEEKAQIEAMLASDKKQWQIIAHEIRDTKKKYEAGEQDPASGAPPSSAAECRDRPRRIADRPRAGDDPAFEEGLDSRAEEGMSRTSRPRPSRATTACRLLFRRDDFEDSGAARATARSIRWRPPNCRAGARRASRCA